MENKVPDHQSIKIVQWNVLAKWASDTNAFPEVNPALLIFEYRFPLILKKIEEFGADIYTFEEVDFVKDLDIFFEDKGYNTLSYAKVSGQDSLYIAYNPEKLGIQEEKNFNFFEPENPEKKMNQVYKYIKFETLNCVNRKEFVLISTHLKAKAANYEIRAVQTSQILGKLKIENPKNLPTIILGDLNSDPEEDSISNIVKEGFKSALVDAEFSTTTYKIRSKKLFNRMIDYIFFKGEIEISKGIEVYKECLFQEGVGLPSDWMPSDHLPISATLKFV